MNRDQFNKYFQVLASIPYNRQETIDLKASVYFEALKMFTWQTFDDVVCHERDTDEHLAKELRAPSYYKNKCMDLQTKKNMEKPKDNQDSEIGRRPQDIKASKEFFMLCAKLADEKGIPNSLRKSGIAHISYSMGIATTKIFEHLTGKKILKQ